MPLILPLIAVGAVLFFLARKSAPGGVAPVWIPVQYASGQIETGVMAQWHATDDQTKLFGPRRPDYWSRNGYFMFAKASGGGYDYYKPDWRVPIEAR